MGNSNLSKAKKAKNDEFYTQKADIEAELCHYAKFFEGKRVYCNCDDPEASEFWKFFKRNFVPWKLKSLTATHYEPDEKNYAYKLELSEDTNGDGKVNWLDDPVQTQIPCNGDFRSQTCIELLKECDIVVTNPPFSLFRSFIAQLVEMEKDFVVLGNKNAITYKEIFPLLKENKMWLGYGFVHDDAYFRIDKENAENYAKGVYNPETGLVHFRNCTWYTNFDIDKRHEKLDLRGNYYKGHEDNFPKYDNYDAIEVNKVSNIPCDYDGVMGVPITFMDKYCPEQFEIIDINPHFFSLTKQGKEKPKQLTLHNAGRTKDPYARILIKKAP